MIDDPQVARWMTDGDDFDPDAIIRDLEQQQRRMADAQRQLAATTLKIQSPDRLVTITMSGASALTGVDIHPNAFQNLGADQLGPLVLRTVQEGMARAGQIVRQELNGVFDDQQIVEDAMRSWPGAASDEADEDPSVDSAYSRRH